MCLAEILNPFLTLINPVFHLEHLNNLHKVSDAKPKGLAEL